MRRAEWRRRADDPTTLLGWWWRGVLAESWPLNTVGGIVISVAAASGLIGLAVGTAAFMFLVNGARALLQRDRLQPLLLAPAPEGQFRANAVYGRGRLVTEEDEMALTVVDGWLIGEGLRSHFALRPEDVLRFRTRPNWRTQLMLKDQSEIRLLGTLGSAQATLEEWHSLAALPVGESTFPSMFVHSKQFSLWIGWMVMGFLIMAIPNVVKPFSHLPAELIDFALALGTGVLFFSGRRFFRLVDLMTEARKDAVARITQGSSIFVDVLGSRIEIKGEANSLGHEENEQRPVFSSSAKLRLGVGEE